MRSLTTRRVGKIATTLSAAALVWLLVAGGAIAGNNGTLKIHEIGTPTDTPNNDPKVCRFDVEALNLDEGQTGYLVFSVQGGDDPQGVQPAGPTLLGPADANGYAISDEVSLAAGHYKATLYGKDDLTDVKAKSKVFKVTCEGGGGGGGGGGTG
jgi:hypothetical protein